MSSEQERDNPASDLAMNEAALTLNQQILTVHQVSVSIDSNERLAVWSALYIYRSRPLDNVQSLNHDCQPMLNI